MSRPRTFYICSHALHWHRSWEACKACIERHARKGKLKR